jgi:hypothetical protein
MAIGTAGEATAIPHQSKINDSVAVGLPAMNFDPIDATLSSAPV